MTALAAAILFNLRQKVIDCGKNFRQNLNLKFFAGPSEDYIRKTTHTEPGVRLSLEKVIFLDLFNLEHFILVDFICELSK